MKNNRSERYYKRTVEKQHNELIGILKEQKKLKNNLKYYKNYSEQSYLYNCNLIDEINNMIIISETNT